LGAAFPWLLALRYLLSRWVNVLGVLGVAVAVWALIVVPSIFSGFIADIHSQTRRTSPDLLLTSLPNDSDYGPLQQALAEDRDVVATAPRLRHYGMLYPRRGGSDRPFSVEVDFNAVGTNFVQLIGIDPRAGTTKVKFLKDAQLTHLFETVQADAQTNVMQAPRITLLKVGLKVVVFPPAYHAFRRIIRAGTSISTGQPLAVIGWDAALCALEAGQMPCASSEQAILRIAASLGDPEIPVRLRTVLGNLDTRNITLVADAITAANG